MSEKKNSESWLKQRARASGPYELPRSESTRGYRLIQVFVGGLLLLVMALMLTQCAPNTGNVDPTFTSLYTNFFYNTCYNCHRSGGPGPTFTVDSAATAYNSLSQTAQGSSSSGCFGIKLVQPGSATQSFILAILSPDYTISGCTPYSEHHTNLAISQAFTSHVKSALVQWINDGAANN